MKFFKDGVFDYSVTNDSSHSFFQSAKDYIKNLKEEDLSADFSGIRPKLFLNGKPKSEFYLKEESDNGFPWISVTW